MEEDNDTGNMVMENLKEYTIAACDFIANIEHPWEVSVRKGASLKVLESITKWWKVEVDGRIGYVPANCLEPLIPGVPTMSNEEQFNYIDNDTVENGCGSEDQEATGILGRTSFEGVQRRRSSRLAENPHLVPVKKSKLDLTWVAAVEQYQKQKKTPLELFKTVSKAGHALVGPRDIVKAPGLNKISVFPDLDVKIEKLEPPDDESNDSPSSSTIFLSATDTGPISSFQLSPNVSLEDSSTELETTTVKEEIDIDESSCEFVLMNDDCKDVGEFVIYNGSPGAVQEESELLPNFNTALCLENTTDAGNVLFSSGNATDRNRNVIMSSDFSMESSISPVVQCSVHSSSNPTVSGLISTPTLDNSTNPCCILFPKVWEILGVLYDPVPVPSCDVIYTPNIVLNLRLVCRDWRKGVDAFYNNISDTVHDELFQSNMRNRQRIRRNLKPRETPRFCPSTWHVYKFKSSYKIQKFLDHFEGTHSVSGSDSVQGSNIGNNPFLGRFVCFRKPAKYKFAMPVYITWVTELLKKYGSHIWYCSIQIDEDITYIHGHITHLLEWLRLMPNLRYFHWNNEYLTLTNWAPEDKSHAYHKFLHILKSKTNETTGQGRPILAELKNLQVVEFPKLPFRALCQFLLGDFQIDKLPNASSSLDVSPQIYLKDLRVSIYSEEFKDLELLKQNWSLKLLKITVKEDLDKITFRRTIKVAERWKNTLTHVSIKYPMSAKSNCTQLPWQLDLPCLKYLKLNFNHRPIVPLNETTLDFLSPTRASLEYLHLKHSCSGFLPFCDMDIQDNPLHIPVKLPGEGSLPSNKQIPFVNDYNSNIWNVFLKLKTIHEERYHMLDKEADFTYTREGWLSHLQTRPVIRPVIMFQMGGETGYYSRYGLKNPRFDRKTLSEYNEARVKTSLDSEYERVIRDLLCEWQNLNNLDLDKNPTVETDLKAKFLRIIQQYAKKGLHPSLEAYSYSNYRKTNYNKNPYLCGMCPNKPTFDGDEKMDEHFSEYHFLYRGVYRCDYIGCEELFPSKYDVVQHRMAHGRNHMKIYYELEAEPVQNLESPELYQLFYWIHVNCPQRYASPREFSRFKKNLKSH